MKKNTSKFNGYELSNGWFEFLKNNASRVNTNHSALYMYIVHKANKFGWPNEFRLPSENSMHASGFNNYKSYKRTLDELIEFGVIELVTEAKNQHTATVIALVKMTEATTKAVPKQRPKQSIGNDQSTSEAVTKAVPTYINNKTSVKGLNHETIKPLATIETTINENYDSTIDGTAEAISFINNFCNEFGRELIYSIDEMVDEYFLSLTDKEKHDQLWMFTNELETN